MICTNCGTMIKTNSADAIIQRVARYSGLSVGDIIGARHHRKVSYPRFAVCYLARVELKYSYYRIGKSLGGRDHSTIWSGIKTAENLIRENPEFATMIARCSFSARDDEPELRLVA